MTACQNIDCLAWGEDERHPADCVVNCCTLDPGHDGECEFAWDEAGSSAVALLLGAVIVGALLALALLGAQEVVCAVNGPESGISYCVAEDRP